MKAIAISSSSTSTVSGMPPGTAQGMAVLFARFLPICNSSQAACGCKWLPVSQCFVRA
jgi:hypothetical protein